MVHVRSHGRRLGSNSLTLKASGFRRVDDGASVAQGRRSQRQRVFDLVRSSAMKIKSEEEAFPCLRQTGESSSSFLTHAPWRGLPIVGLCTPWTPFRGLPWAPPGLPRGHLRHPVGPPSWAPWGASEKLFEVVTVSLESTIKTNSLCNGLCDGQCTVSVESTIKTNSLCAQENRNRWLRE